jgi:chromate reductase, NAD(P)H dehydrogenase (quinone)
MNRKIIIITASEVKNMDLAVRFSRCLAELQADTGLINLVELDLPLYSSRTEEKFKGNELLANVIGDISSAHGFVFIAPEYNGSTPPVFNNFIAWLSRSSKDWREFFNGKPAAIATFSGGGGFNVLLAMRTQLSFIGMNVLGRQILTHSNKALDDNSLKLVNAELIKLTSCS